jgi:hypothetical protein
MYAQVFTVDGDVVHIEEDKSGDWCDEDYTCSLAKARKIWKDFTQRGWVQEVSPCQL